MNGWLRLPDDSLAAAAILRDMNERAIADAVVAARAALEADPELGEAVIARALRAFEAKIRAVCEEHLAVVLRRRIN
jgi:hypothetical protein